jgi:Sulfotransferase family
VSELSRDSGPVVILSYPYAGVERLVDTVSGSPSVFCTQGTGLLPLCHTAASTWQNLEQRGTGPSALAIRSIRSLVNTMATAVQSGSGGSRWCEIAYAGTSAAETFLRIFPEAAFLCLHRNLAGVFAEGTAAHPWGLGASPFWAFAGPHPGNNVATIASFWAACTEPLLDFETAHPQSCLRVRWEDLDTDPGGQASKIFGHLGIETPRPMAPDPFPPTRPGTGAAEAAAAIPPENLPPPLLAKVTGLHTRLDYRLPGPGA